MRAVVDSSSWISLARSGLMEVLTAAAVQPVLPDVVMEEVVAEGRRGGHADAAALSTLLAGIPVSSTSPGGPADARVLEAARDVGVLIANDLALGRRARSLGVQWVRTADLLVVAVMRGAMTSLAAAAGLRALAASGRISQMLFDEYMERLR